METGLGQAEERVLPLVWHGQGKYSPALCHLRQVGELAMTAGELAQTQTLDCHSTQESRPYTLLGQHNGALSALISTDPKLQELHDKGKQQEV